MNNLEEIQSQIDIVKNEILTKFPGVRYTIRILLWDDGTSSVECKHGTSEGKLYVATYYNNELSFEERDINRTVMVVDECGKEYYLSY